MKEGKESIGSSLGLGMSTLLSDRSRAGGLVSRIGIIGVDQGISSLTNLVATVVAARFVGPDGLGIVAVCMVTAYTVIGLNRAATGEPLLVYGSSLSLKGAFSLATIIGVAGATLMLGLGAVMDKDVRTGMWLTAFTVPGLVVGDTARYAFISQGRPTGALICDVAWALVQVVTSFLLLGLRDVTPTWVLLSWALGGLVGACIGWIRLTPGLSIKSAQTWWKSAKRLSGWAFAQVATGQIGYQVVILSVAGVAGFASVGALRLSQTVLSPLALILTVVMLAALPEIRKERDVALSNRVRKAVLFATVGAAIVSLAFAGAISLGEHWLLTGVFGSSFRRFEVILAPVALCAIVQGMTVGPGIGIRAFGEGPALFITQVCATALGVPLIIVLAWMGGSEGAAWGLLGQLLILCLAGWITYARIQREAEATE